MQKPVILKTIYEPGITDGKQRMYPRGQISGKVQEVRITTMGVSLVDALWKLCTVFYYYMEIRVLGTTRKRREKNDGKTIQPWKERSGRHGKAPGSL